MITLRVRWSLRSNVSIGRASTSRSLFYCLFAPRIGMVLFFTHIPFVVNHTINATPPERLQQLQRGIRHILNLGDHPCIFSFFSTRLVLLSPNLEKRSKNCVQLCCLLNAGIEEFPPIFQLISVRTTMLCRRDAHMITGISVGFFNIERN